MPQLVCRVDSSDETRAFFSTNRPQPVCRADSSDKTRAFFHIVELSQLYDLQCAIRSTKHDMFFKIVELTHFRKSC